MGYITVADVRAAGMTDTTTYPDDDVQAAIDLWGEAIDKVTRQWFDSRALVMKLDGTNSDTLHFGVPIISINYVKLNGDDSELDTSYYEVYNSRSYPDDRKNPRIKLKREQGVTSIFTSPIGDGSLIFRKGRRNQEVSGNFGFTEADGSTPKLIKRALLKLVLEKLQSPAYTAPGSLAVTPPPILAGVVQEEWTDGHKVKYAGTFEYGKQRAPGFLGLTQDPEIISILKWHRAPLAMATPADWTPQ